MNLDEQLQKITDDLRLLTANAEGTNERIDKLTANIERIFQSNLRFERIALKIAADFHTRLQALEAELGEGNK